MMCFALFFGVGCSKQTEPMPKLSKEMFVSKEQQLQIAKFSKAIFDSINKEIAAGRKQKSGAADSILQDPDVFLQKMLAQIRIEDSISYDAFANSSEGANFIQNYKNIVPPQGFDNATSSMSGYLENIDNTLSNVESGSETANSDTLSKKMIQITVSYENAILNDINLSNDDKTILLTTTTYILANTDNIIELLYNLTYSDSQRIQKAGGRGWRALKRRIVSAFIWITIGVVSATTYGIIFGSIFPPSSPARFLRNLKTGAIVGAAVGFAASIYLMTQNQCTYIFRGRLILRPCK